MELEDFLPRFKKNANCGSIFGSISFKNSQKFCKNRQIMTGLVEND
jgi:hypothetical protein